MLYRYGIDSLKQGELKLIKSFSAEIADYEQLLEKGFSGKLRLLE
jgi:hypothetical protein